MFASSISFECMDTEQIRSERSGQFLSGESAEILHRTHRKIQTPGVSPASLQKSDAPNAEVRALLASLTRANLASGF